MRLAQCAHSATTLWSRCERSVAMVIYQATHLTMSTRRPLSARPLREQFLQFFNHLADKVVEPATTQQLNPITLEVLDHFLQERDEIDEYTLDSLDACQLAALRTRWNTLHDHGFRYQQVPFKEYEEYEDILSNWCEIIHIVKDYMPSPGKVFTRI